MVCTAAAATLAPPAGAVVVVLGAVVVVVVVVADRAATTCGSTVVPTGGGVVVDEVGVVAFTGVVGTVVAGVVVVGCVELAVDCGCAVAPGVLRAAAESPLSPPAKSDRLAAAAASASSDTDTARTAHQCGRSRAGRPPEVPPSWLSPATA
jgi:hypothetical protein